MPLPLSISLAISLAVAVAYLAAVPAARRRGGGWPVWRTLLWCAGLAVAAAALVGPVAAAAHRNFTAHLLGHLLLGMLAPLLLVPAAPVTLALRALPLARARTLSRLLKSTPVRVLTHPVVAALLNVAGLWLLHTTSLYRQMTDHESLHVAVHAHMLITGYLFTAAIIGVDPAPHRPGYRLRAVVLVAFLAAHDILAKHLYAHPPAGVSAAQAQSGGQLMYYGGDLLDLGLIVVFCSQWYAATRIDRPAGPPADQPVPQPVPKPVAPGREPARGTGTGTRLPVEYVLPLRWSDDAGLDELDGYLRRLSVLVDITVVDASPPALFARHAAVLSGAVLSGAVRHLAPDPDLRFLNGKVNGVTTGLRTARHEHVVIADDDVRYDEAGLRAVDALLRHHDLVRPQNYFRPLPWHARWDTARTLLNRAVGADYPGTLAVRRSTFLGMGGYDGDVLFENLELIRTVAAYGGSEAHPLDTYVRRLPPDASRFWSQRVRQAYDDLAQPARHLMFLTVLPTALAAALAGRGAALAAVAGCTVALAEFGRRRAGGVAVYPATASLLAPVWVLERAACAWVALALRLTRGGVCYAGRRVLLAAHPRSVLAGRLGPLAADRSGSTGSAHSPRRRT